MSVLIIWQSLVVQGYRSVFNKMLASAPQDAIGLIAPSAHRELGGQRIDCAPFLPPWNTSPQATAVSLKSASLHAQIVLFHGLGAQIRKFFQHPGAHKNVIFCFAEPFSITALLTWFDARQSLGKNFRFVCYSFQNLPRKYPWPIRAVQKFLHGKIDLLLVPGREQRDVARHFGFRGPIETVPLWYDSSRFKLGKPHGENTVIVGFSGSLVAEKGIEDLLDALAREPWDDIVFRCCGGGPLAGTVRQRVAALKVPSEFLGPLPAEAMPEFFQGIDILVVPSRTADNWKEQFGRVIVEAMACGAYVIGSDSGAIPEVIGDAEAIFAERDITALVRTLQRAVGYVRAARSRGEDSRMRVAERAQRFSDASVAQRFLDVFRALPDEV